MGQGQSAEEAGACGYRVLGVQPNSPAAKADLVSFFDFVVAANNVPLRTLDSTFIEMIKGSNDRPLPLTIYNLKSETTRDVVLTPSRSWGGQGMLGVTIRFDSYWQADASVIRVLEVQPNTAAEMANLRPETDFLLGTAERVFKDPEALYDECQQHPDAPVEFYVYVASMRCCCYSDRRCCYCHC